MPERGTSVDWGRGFKIGFGLIICVDSGRPFVGDNGLDEYVLPHRDRIWLECNHCDVGDCTACFLRAVRDFAAHNLKKTIIGI